MNNPLKTLFTFLGKANSEASGQPSNIRTVVFYTFGLIIPCIGFCLIYVSIKYESIIPVVLGLILGFLGTLLGIKKAQKNDESKPAVTDETNS